LKYARAYLQQVHQKQQKQQQQKLKLLNYWLYFVGEIIYW
jgi:hypothetical protein